MQIERNAVILDYLHNLQNANSESAKKELFLTLVVRLFEGDTSAQRIIAQINLGAEQQLGNTQNKSYCKADTQYGHIIIEFKKSLAQHEQTAKEQLHQYLMANWTAVQEYDFILIATDCQHWKIYTPCYETMIKSHKIELTEHDYFSLTETNCAEFFFFLDRHLFCTEKRTATLQNIQISFGESSGTFLTAIGALKQQFDKIKHLPEVKTAFDQWHKFLSIAYGSFQANEDIFLVHTYLNILSKILAYIVLQDNGHKDENTWKAILNGSIFRQFKVYNFAEDDFFRWVILDDNLACILPALRTIEHSLDMYDFFDVKEDILKGVYQELIDLETRHALGEYYTPDWLCEKIVSSLDLKPDSKILDPACGSGSFLRATIARLTALYPNLPVENIVENIVGIDIHPLSVQISKTTILLALVKKLRTSKKEIHFKVFLANTLFLPEGSVILSEHIYLISQFDFVIGNPPWLTYKDVKNPEYQSILKELAIKYNVLPKISGRPNMELAVLFLTHATSFFLKPKGQAVFVLPRSILNADHHDNIRTGKARGFRIIEIWDLYHVSPLFRVPACVLFAQKYINDENENQTPSLRSEYISPIPGYSFAGKLEQTDSHWQQVERFLTIQPSQWRYAVLGRNSAFSCDKGQDFSKPNHYRNEFKAGATIIPRCFYFVSLTQETPPDWENRIVSMQTLFLDEAKLPWKNISLQGQMDSRFFFRTALAKNVVPYGLIRPALVVLPIHITQENGIELWDWETILHQGYLETAKWFRQAEQLWETHRTPKNKKISTTAYLNWQNKLTAQMSANQRIDFQRGITAQNLSQQYLVIYTGSGKDANATIVDRTKLDLQFMADSTTYWFATNNIQIAYYLVGFLNSNYASRIIKAFQPTGLFGPRHISKRILDIPLPQFSASNPQHVALANLAQICTDKVSQHIQRIGVDNYRVAKLRSDIRKLLAKDLASSDKIVKQLAEA